MRRYFVLAGMACLAASSSAAVLFDNGPFITGIGDGAGGANTSMIEAPNTLFGSNANNATFRMADDFVVTGAGWDISSIMVRGYQTGSTTTSTFTGAFIEIYNGAPNAGGVVIFGDQTTNRLASSAWSGVYRVTATTLTNNQRPIMDIDISTTGLSLGAGTYWISVSLTGSLGSGPWMNPTVPADGTDNALQWTGAAWQAMNGGTNNHDLPFVVNGTPVPEPATMAVLGLGAVALLRRRRK